MLHPYVHELLFWFGLVNCTLNFTPFIREVSVCFLPQIKNVDKKEKGS